MSQTAANVVPDGEPAALPKQSQMPSEAQLNELYALKVRDKDDKEVPFSSLVKGTAESRNVIIWIRHFFCGVSAFTVTSLSQHTDG